MYIHSRILPNSAFFVPILVTTRNSLSNLPVTDNLEATITRIVEEQLGKLPSSTPNNLPSDEVLERLSILEKKLEDLSNRPETIPSSLLEQNLVEPEQILSNIPGIAPGEVGSVSLEVAETARQLEEEAAEKLESLVVEVDAIASPDTSDEPDPELNLVELEAALEPSSVAVEQDANAPVVDQKLNSLELNSALEPDLETVPGFSEAAPPLELERIEEAAAEKLESLVVEVEASEQKKNSAPN